MSTGYYPFKNLVFEGGGVKGVAYAGVMEVLEPAAILPQITSVAGTSAGAITATLVSLNYSADEVFQIMMATDFSKFEDGSDLGGPIRFIEDYGWFKGDYFVNLMEGYIADKTGSKNTTFGELVNPPKPVEPPFKELYVFGTDVSQQCWQEFS
ncbi:MAG: patatin-like phospholipase family protein, partial [Acidobacteria bacterium]|nr:patatin-like phospholipase family protein [Acidobacteriota bacterium]